MGSSGSKEEGHLRLGGGDCSGGGGWSGVEEGVTGGRVDVERGEGWRPQRDYRVEVECGGAVCKIHDSNQGFII